MQELVVFLHALVSNDAISNRAGIGGGKPAGKTGIRGSFMVTGNHPVDWLQSSAEERKKLYPVACAVKNLLGLKDWNAFLALALERPQHFSEAFAGNFRKGKIRRKIAADIYSWIAAHHLDVGQRLCKDLFPTSSLTAWEELVTGHGLYGYLHIRNPEALALTSRDDDGLQIEDEPILLKEPYCFLLEDQPSGNALLIERHEGGDWFPVPIGATSKALVASFPKERALLPWDSESQKPVILREHVDAGVAGIHPDTWGGRDNKGQ